MATRGTLFLVPAPLDFGCEPPAPLDAALPAGALRVAAGLTHWICENAKTTRAVLKRIGELHPLAAPLQQQHVAELPRELHKKGDTGTAPDLRHLLEPALQGRDIGLMSEAGLPAVADPGASVVRCAHDLGLAVVPLAGPSSLLLALAGSGLNGQSFAYVGYLPQDASARVQRIKELEALALRIGQAQLFIETPYRNTALLAALLQTLRPDTRLAVSSGLTLATASTRSLPVARWRSQPVDIGDAQAVFAIGR